MVLTEDDKEWVENALTMGYTRLQLRKKLEGAKFKEERLRKYLDYFDEIKEKEEELEIKKNKKDEELFKESIKSYYEGNKKELGFGERRAIKKFIKNTAKYMEVMKASLKGFKDEIKALEDKGLNEKDFDKEMEDVKKEIIDRIIDSKDVLDIEHPITKEEATRENLKDLELDSLILMIEDNIDTLSRFVGGKIE